MADKRNALMGEMRATPRNALMGTVADALGSVSRFANTPDKDEPSRKANALLAFLSNGLGVGDVAATADRMSYGHDLTRGAGMARQMLPETAGTLMTAGPMAAKYPLAAGKLAMGAMNGGADVAMGAERAATVWHGSPHKFDKFDSSKIGTGEGAQAYGHGLYLAESPAVAQTYKDLNPTALASPIRAFRGAELAPGTPEYHAATLLDNMGLQQARRTVSGWIANAEPRMAREAEGWTKTLETLNSATSKADFKQLKNQGNLYQVDLPDEKIARMLDWDKPLSQQAPSVRAAVMATKKQLTPDDIENLGGAGAVRALYDPANKIDNFLGTWESLRGKRDAGETLLRQQGIPGIRYLDGNSRGVGTGSSNYVVFPGEENALSILERNGKALR